MATSVIPGLMDAIIATAEDVLEIRVVDSIGHANDPGDYLMVGVEDPDVEGYTVSARSAQDWANANYTSRDEEGDVTCAAYSWNGDTDQKAARDAVYATAAALEQSLRENPPQNLPDVLWTSFGVSGSELNQIQDKNGAAALLLFSIHFKARI